MWAFSVIVAMLQTSYLFVGLMHVVVFLENGLHVGKRFCLYELPELKILSVGPQ